jgi:hypothetical protein
VNWDEYSGGSRLSIGVNCRFHERSYNVQGCITYHVAVDWPVKVDSWTSPGEGVWVRISCADRVRDSLNNRCTWWSTRHKIYSIRVELCSCLTKTNVPMRIVFQPPGWVSASHSMRQGSPVLKICSSVGVTGLISARAREMARTTIQRGEWRMVDELYERIVEER